MLRFVFAGLLLAVFGGNALAGPIFRFTGTGSSLPAPDTGRVDLPGPLSMSIGSDHLYDAVPSRNDGMNLIADTVPVAGNGLSASSDSILAKRDSVVASNKNKRKKKDSGTLYKDSVLKKGANPGRVSLYSAILPGLGQIYNRKYWKLPLVYAAVGIPAYAFFYNKKWYQRVQYALTVTVNQSPADSVAKVDKSLKPFVTNADVSGLITYRDSFRKNQDYSVLFFVLLYGLQIVDATVDAHLKGFNVNDDLSLKIIPNILSSSTCLAGVSLVFDIHKPVPRPLRMN